MQEVDNVHKQKQHLKDLLTGKIRGFERGFMIEDVPQGNGGGFLTVLKTFINKKWP